MRRSRIRAWAAMVLASTALAVAIAWARWPASPERFAQPIAPRGEFIALPAGELRGRRVEAFLLARAEVTNAEFAEFVAATRYRTTAERDGSARVFDRASGRWRRDPQANWRRPAGLDSSIAGRDRYPVVQLSWFDAQAYAAWRGGRLPTEAEWELAARGALRDARFPWGAEERPRGRYQANYWQGWFPQEDLARDGFAGLAPCGSYPPTGEGFSDLTGNVWEWCLDEAPHGGRALRGGSWTSAENYLPGYELSFRRGLPPESAWQDVGFRIVGAAAPPASNISPRLANKPETLDTGGPSPP